MQRPNPETTPLNDILITAELSRTLIANLPGGAVFVVDRDLRYLLAEGDALATAGFKPEDLVGRTIFEVLPPELIASYEPMYRQALAGEPFEHEHSAHHRFYISRGAPLRTADGEVYAVLVISYDITNRKCMEAAQQQAEASIAADLRETQLLQDLSTRLITEADIQVLYNEILAGAIALMQADAGSLQVLDEATQDLVLLATHGFERNMTEHFYRVNASSNTPCGLALRNGDRTFVDFDVSESEDPDGSCRMHVEAGYLSAQSTPLIARSGKAIGMVSTHWHEHYRPSDRELRFLDLLARQAANLIEQRQAEQLLRESEAKYRSLFNSIDEGFCIFEMIYDENDWAVDYRFVEVNPVFERQTGLKNVVGKLGSEIAPNTERYWLETYDQVLKTGNPQRIDNYNQATDRWYSAYASWVSGVGSRQVYTIFNDITERKRRELNTAFLDEIGKELSVLSAPDEIIQTVGERLGEFLQASSCIFADVDEAKNEATIHHGWNTTDVVSLKQTFRLADYFGEEFARAGRAGETVIVRDTAQDERANAEAYARLKIGSFVTVPFQRNGRWTANITVTTREPRDWREDEIELLQEIINRVFPRIERARAEEALRESEAKYRSLFNSIDEGFCIFEMIYDENDWAVDYRFVEVNPVFERQTGLKNVVGKLGSEIAPNTERYWLETYDQVLKTGNPQRMDSYNQATDRWYSAYASPISNTDRRQVCTVFSDITERKQQEQRQAYLLQLSDTLRSLSDAVEIQATVTRTTMNFFGTDRCYYCEIIDGNVIIRRDAAQADLPSVVGVYPLENSPLFKVMLNAGQPFVFEDVHTTNVLDENLRQTCVQLQIIAALMVPVIKQGEPVGILCITQTTLRNWTALETELAQETAERIWAAVERARAEAALRESEERQSFLLKLSDALRELDDAASIKTLANRLLGLHLGVDRVVYEEYVRKDDKDYWLVENIYHVPDYPLAEGLYPVEGFGRDSDVVLKGDTAIVDDVFGDVGIAPAVKAVFRAIDVAAYVALPIVRDGKTIALFVLNQGTPRTWTPQAVGLLKDVADRTWAAVERARAEDALRASEIQRVREQAAREEERQRALREAVRSAELAELDRAKTLFFSNISHEFRTPLTLSLAPLQDALSDRTRPLDPIQRERLELAHHNSLRLLKLVNTLLDFSRLEVGRMEAVYEPTDLATFTAELASVFRSAIEQAGLRFIVDCPPLPEAVFVDREMWEKIVLNLLSNAFKFTFEGEIAVSLSVESRVEHHTSTSNSHNLTSDSHSPDSDLDTSTAKRQISGSELDTPTAEFEPLTAEPEALTAELEASTLELETLTSELKTASFERKPSSNLQVILQIHDTGTGIAPEHLPHLFERFYQVRSTQARTHEGSGIGLALVHELVRLHGGTIAVNSTVEEGTCFTIALPFGTEHLPQEHLHTDRAQTSTVIDATSYVEEAERWLSADLDPPHPSLATGENSVKVPLNKGDLGGSPASQADIILRSSKVLIVDDNADMREYLTRILGESVQVEAVADGATALAIAQERTPDLILSDVMMPGLNGFELLQALRSNPRTREIPLILLSARAGEEAIVEGLQAGADDYLIKPFSAQELISRVTTHLQIAQLRREALDQERRINQQKDKFMSVISHELNTPLVSILGWTRMLRSQSPSAATLSKALDTIERNATLQAKLVQDLLDLSRITAGKLHLQLQPIALQPVIETAIATVTQTATDQGIHVIWQEHVTEPTVVMGDGDRLTQVLINLLTNAIKFTPASGSVNVALSVEAPHSPTPHAKIQVTDTGIGITAEFLPHVFDRFRQADDANAAKGLGLGLAIARHIVELHHGTIQADSAGTGKGATFTVRLPMQ